MIAFMPLLLVFNVSTLQSPQGTKNSITVPGPFPSATGLPSPNSHPNTYCTHNSWSFVLLSECKGLFVLDTQFPHFVSLWYHIQVRLSSANVPWNTSLNRTISISIHVTETKISSLLITLFYCIYNKYRISVLSHLCWHVSIS